LNVELGPGGGGGDQGDWIGVINTVIHLQCLPILQKQTGCLKFTHSAGCTPQTDSSVSLISVGLSQPCVGAIQRENTPSPPSLPSLLSLCLPHYTLCIFSLTLFTPGCVFHEPAGRSNLLTQPPLQTRHKKKPPWP
jgi:hypothetical protein